MSKHACACKFISHMRDGVCRFRDLSDAVADLISRVVEKTEGGHYYVYRINQAAS